MTNDTDRREVARRLRGIDPYYDSIGAIKKTMCTSPAQYLADLAGALGYSSEHDVSRYDFQSRLADLLDPTCEARRDALFYPATGLTPDHEETVYRCGECGEIISYDEGYDPETDLPAYCERCGSRITGIGEPWDE